MADDFLQGAQIGLGIAQQWANRSARAQEQRVQEAYRRMQERQMAAQAERAAAQTEMFKRTAQEAVQEQADFTNAQIEYSALVDLGMPPDQAYMKSVVPAMIKHRPKEAGAAVLDGLRIPLIEKANQALVEQREASARLSNTKADELETEAWLGPGNMAVKPTAVAQNTQLLNDAKTAYDSAVETGDETVIKKAKTHLDAVKTAMHANREEERAARITDQAFRATHQTILTKLRNLYTQRSSPITAKQRTALDTEIEGVEDQLDALVQGYSNQQTGEALAPAASEEVTVISPDGVEGTIPRANLDKALKRGFKLKQ